jgi:ABC-type transport system involved in multi-copper enzyme maturation permease subunit
MTHLLTIARVEWIAALRLKWLRTLTAAFALLAAAAACSAGAANDLSGADGFARTAMALVPVVLILVPLASLVLGISGQAAESGGEPFLFSQPIGRATVLVGRWLGECAALVSATAGGLAIGGVVIAAQAGVDGLASFVFFVATAAILAIIFLSIAAGLSATIDSRVTALGAGVFAWFFFVLFYDAAVLSVATWLSGPRGGRVLFGSIFGNPVDLVRVIALTLSGTPHALGAAGEAWVRFLGGPWMTAAASASAIAIWVIAPLVIGVRFLAARDL